MASNFQKEYKDRIKANQTGDGGQNMMRVTDFIAEYIYKNLGVDKVFMLTGGGAMFLNDGVAKHPHLDAVCNHHEQACAMAGVGYAKYSGKPGVVYVTTGCGGTNTITGLLDAWQDNVPCLFISGQVKKKETVHNSNLPLRQIGVQEADIIAVVKSLTKYAVMINQPDEIKYHLEKAMHLAISGRPGPVWLDIPLDVQGAVINDKQLKGFSKSELINDYKELPDSLEMETLTKLITSARRPIIVVGNGIRLSNSMELFKSVVEKYSIPVVSSYLGIDLLPYDHRLHVGTIGIKGSRAGNFAVQNSDLVIGIGTRMCVPMTGFEYNLFAREAKVVVIDIDRFEHKKNTIKIDLFINADAGKFLEKLQSIGSANDYSQWIKKCQHWKKMWPVCLPEYANETEGINMYYLIDRISAKMKDDAVVVSDAGSSYFVTSQAIKIKSKQRYITSGAQADMGFALPAAIGICVARGNKEVVGITGDGSLQLNIQELQTVIHNKFPIKLFVLNNNGYLSIRTTQMKFFECRYIGTDSSCGISFPDLEKIAEAYGIAYFRTNKVDNLEETLDKVFQSEMPVICEVISPANQEVIPTASSQRKEDGKMVSKPLEDMYPFLDRELFKKEMIVKSIEE